MNGDVLPDADHVTRLCGFTQLNEDGIPEGSAFVLKPGETFLSVNWIESLGLGARPEQIAEVLRVLGTKRKVGATAKLGLLNVGRSRVAVREGTTDRLEVSFVHEPENKTPIDSSHSGIYDLPLSDGDITAAEQLALSVSELFPTRYAL